MQFLLRYCKFFLPLAGASLCFAAQPDRITGPIDTSRTVALARSLHPRALPEFDQGPVDPAMKLTYMTMLMAPSPAQQQALDTLLAAQQDRTSPSYHKWLTPQQFADRFGLSQRDLNKVTAWLESQGFEILSLGGGRNSISFSGTASQVQHAFGAEIHSYSDHGKKHFANSTPLLIPAALNGIVRTVLGVNSFLPHPTGHFRAPHAMQSSHPDYYDGSYGNFLAPGDIATIYDINALYSSSIDGSNQQLAIVGQTDIYLDDINDFRSDFGLNPITGCSTATNGIVTDSSCNTTYFQYVLVGSDVGTPSQCGDLGESDLDIEWSSAVARNAQIVFVNSPVTYPDGCNGPQEGGGVNASLNAVINPTSGPPLAPVVSMSYGACERESADLETLLKQGNAEGVTILNSSGDVGAAECDYNPPNSSVPYNAAVGGFAVSYPASSPEVTGVGGTEITIANDFPASSYWGTSNGTNGGSVLRYIPEIQWNDDVEIAQYCQQYYTENPFCTQGGSTAVKDWVPLESAATAQQVEEDIWLSIGGGGASNCLPGSSTCTGGFAQPAFQNGLSVTGAPAGVRWVPDVSMLASPNFPGYIFCTAVNPAVDGSTCADGIPTAISSYGSIVGGTSASSPILAGIVTLLNQYVVTNGIQGTPGLGNINSNLYILAASPSNAVFNQVTSGTNDVYCQPNTPAGQPASIQCPSTGVLGYSASNFDATTHYNLVTGLGSIDANNLTVAWNNLAHAPNFTIQTTSNLTPSSVPAGQSATAVLTIAPVNGSTQSFTLTSSSCSGMPAGATCSFRPSNFTLDGTDSQTVNLTISTTANMKLPSGAQTITVTAASGSSSHSTTVNLTITYTNQSFTLSATSGVTYQVAPGGSATVNLSIAGSNGFINTSNSTTVLPLTYTCTGSPSLPAAEISCVLPNNGQPTNATAVTVALQTTAPTTQLQRPFDSRRVFYALFLPGLFGIVFAAFGNKRGVRLLSMIVVLGCCSVGLVSCGGGGNSGGGGGSNPGTPAGQYIVTIGATTGGSVPLTNSNAPYTITLNVSQ